MNAARLFDSAVAVYGLQTLAAHLRLLPERDPHAGLFDALVLMIGHLNDPVEAAELVVRFELLILEELGFGLDLSACAATGVRDDLGYVSPKSGRAVSRAAGTPWRDKMLALPAFLLRGTDRHPEPGEIEDAYRLTGYFLQRHVYQPRGMTEPEARAGFIGALHKMAKVPAER